MMISVGKIVLRGGLVSAVLLMAVFSGGCSDTIIQEPDIIGVIDLPGSVYVTTQTDLEILRGLQTI